MPQQGDFGFDSKSGNCLPGLGVSGRYQYKDWVEVSPGQFEARPVRPTQGHIPALINSAYRNPTGERTVYGLVFDLDAFDPADPNRVHAELKWHDAEGRLDWPLMEKALRKVCPELADSITLVVRSSGGKGLAVVVGINPLPIRPTTTKNQTAARSLQGRIAAEFTRLGFGADPFARGLERDFPNWKDPSRAIVVKTGRVRQIEQFRLSIVSDLHRILNALDKTRLPFRLYPDARVEQGLALLVSWMFGEFVPKSVSSFLGETRPTLGGGSTALRPRSHFSDEEAFVTVRQLQELTGLGEGFLRRFLAEPPAWLLSEYVSRDEGWRIRIPIRGHFAELLARARLLRTQSKRTTIGTAWSPLDLPRPEGVEHGMRNAWIVKLALSLKWAGFSFETTLRKVELRIPFIPGHEASRNCRQVRKIVRCLFQRMPEHEGRFPHRSLPEWMTNDALFARTGASKDNCIKKTHSNTGRGIAPGAFPDSSVPLLEVCSFQSESPRGLESIKGSLKGTVERPRVRVDMIRWKQRIGLVHSGEVFAVFTRAHFRAAFVLEKIQTLPLFHGVTPYLFAPREREQAQYRKDVERAAVTPSWIVCGRRETRAVTIARRVERGNATENALMLAKWELRRSEVSADQEEEPF